MLAKFFIDRPIFAWVISIVILLAGGVAALTLPIAQYPEITPPSVAVSCQYPGASANVVVDTVAAPIEQQVNGVERMLYMSSTSANDGTYNLTVTFELGTNLDMAQVLVQNRVSQATASLPDVVKQTGVTVKKKSPNILLVVNLFSDKDPATGKDRYDQLFLSNYATVQVRDQLSRINGVGDAYLFGQQDYSMRLWLDPNQLATRSLTATDVLNSLKEQNIQVAAGQFGQPPVPAGQAFQYTLTTMGRLQDPKQFGDIVLKSGQSGQITRLRDVAKIELGAKNQDSLCFLDGKQASGIAIYQLPGSNALDVAKRVRAQMEQLKQRFPPGLQYAIVYDTTPFISQSIEEVFKTLEEAIILVAIVVLLFLQDWKSLILPMIDVCVSLVGTFFVMSLLGFTMNNLTLFGLVLAIGIVVDDAIVVLENIERWMAMGYPVREATINAMNEITGSIIAITLVLCSVFLPAAMIGGISGQFYRQFALTIAASMVISAINAMTMTPARAASVFGHRKPGEASHHGDALPWYGVMLVFGWLAYMVAGKFAGGGHGEGEEVNKTLVYGAAAVGALVGLALFKPVNALLRRFFKVFNRAFDWTTNVYGWTVGRFVRLAAIIMLVYAGFLVLTYFGMTHVPTGFVPEQDKGYLIGNIELPDAASLQRTAEVTAKSDAILQKIPGIAHVISLPGYSMIQGANSPNWSTSLIVLQPFEERVKSPELTGNAIIKKARAALRSQVIEARTNLFGAPPVDGLGSGSGFKLMVEDRENAGTADLAAAGAELAARGNETPGLVGLFSTLRAESPQFYVNIDREKAKTMGVPLSEVFNALQVYLGGTYINDFNQFGRTWQVIAQAKGDYRVDAKTVMQFKVRNNKGEMVPLGSVAKVEDSAGPVLLTRYNLYPATAINGASQPGVSSGTVITTMQNLADQTLPSTMAYEWTELTLMQILAGNTAVYVFIAAVVLVFLVLAAQYESWSMPAAIIMVMPMCLLCAVAGVAIARMDINIFVQVGFIVLVGLAAKNAILVVAFAAEQEAKEGKSPFDAVITAAKTRLRPIIMTSFAFILGVLPLVTGKGAGAEMRNTLGTAVFSGMLGVTFFGIFLTPVFYYVVRWFSKGKPPMAPEPVETGVPAGVGGAGELIENGENHPGVVQAGVENGKWATEAGPSGARAGEATHSASEGTPERHGDDGNRSGR